MEIKNYMTIDFTTNLDSETRTPDVKKALSSWTDGRKSAHKKQETQ